jgi:hypothetical protein
MPLILAIMASLQRLRSHISRALAFVSAIDWVIACSFSKSVVVCLLKRYAAFNRPILLAALRAQARDTALDQRFGGRVGDDDCAGRAHRQRIEERLRQVRDAPRAFEEADDFALVVGNGEFIEGADAASEQEHDVSTSDGNDITPFEPEAGVDHHR